MITWVASVILAIGALAIVRFLASSLREAASIPAVVVPQEAAAPQPVSPLTTKAVTPVKNPIVQTSVSPTQVPDRLRNVLSNDGSLGFRERIRSLHGINRNLMLEEVEALYRYLRTPGQQDKNRPYENWLRNEIMDLLVEQTALPQGYPDLLLAIYHDPSQDPVMRDYALQHIPPIYVRANGQEKTDLQNALWQATAETGSGIGGTSLLALVEISKMDPSVDQSRVGDTAFKIVAADGAGELSRITAVQVCGELGVEQSLPYIEQIAQSGATVPLRIAAIAAVGDFLSDDALSTATEARNLLNALASASESRQAKAALAALNRNGRSARGATF